MTAATAGPDRPGRDRRAVLLPPPPGATRVGGPRSTAVVGGGIAGLAAATALAERGVDVTLYEREAYLGGRVGGWSTDLYDGTTATMSRGFHAFSASTTTCAACSAEPVTLRAASPASPTTR